jgi:hypothetical protein
MSLPQCGPIVYTLSTTPASNFISLSQTAADLTFTIKTVTGLQGIEYAVTLTGTNTAGRAVTTSSYTFRVRVVDTSKSYIKTNFPISDSVYVVKDPNMTITNVPFENTDTTLYVVYSI